MSVPQEATGRLERHRHRTLPELGAGGFSRLDGAVEFYQRVRALVGPDDVVLDLGAGRGCFVEDPVEHRRELRRLRGRVGALVGVDVDPVVTTNPTLDRAHVIGPDGFLPLPDASVDAVVADFVLEHVRYPARTAAELTRVLRVGGWICARTPNRWGSIALPARLVPDRLHCRVLARVQPGKQERDTFPTAYRMNTAADLRRWFPETSFRHCSYTHDSEPAYVGRSVLAWSAFRAVAAITPPPLRSMWMVFIQRTA